MGGQPLSQNCIVGQSTKRLSSLVAYLLSGRLTEQLTEGFNLFARSTRRSTEARVWTAVKPWFCALPSYITSCDLM